MTLGAQIPSPDAAADVSYIKQFFARPCLPAQLGEDSKVQVLSNNTSVIFVIGACESTRNLSSPRSFFTCLIHSAVSWFQKVFGSETKKTSDPSFVSTWATFSTFLFKF